MDAAQRAGQLRHWWQLCSPAAVLSWRTVQVPADAVICVPHRPPAPVAFA